MRESIVMVKEYNSLPVKVEILYVTITTDYLIIK